MQFLQGTLDRFNHVSLYHEWTSKCDDTLTFSFDMISFHAVEQYIVFKLSNHKCYYRIVITYISFLFILKTIWKKSKVDYGKY